MLYFYFIFFLLYILYFFFFFFFSSRRRHTRWNCDWSSDVCSSDLPRNGDRWIPLRKPSTTPCATISIPPKRATSAGSRRSKRCTSAMASRKLMNSRMSRVEDSRNLVISINKRSNLKLHCDLRASRPRLGLACNLPPSPRERRPHVEPDLVAQPGHHTDRRPFDPAGVGRVSAPRRGLDRPGRQPLHQRPGRPHSLPRRSGRVRDDPERRHRRPGARPVSTRAVGGQLRPWWSRLRGAGRRRARRLLHR